MMLILIEEGLRAVSIHPSSSERRTSNLAPLTRRHQLRQHCDVISLRFQDSRFNFFKFQSYDLILRISFFGHPKFR